METHSSILQIHGFTEEIDPDRGLICVVEAVIHETSNQGSFANWNIISINPKLIFQKKYYFYKFACY